LGKENMRAEDLEEFRGVCGEIVSQGRKKEDWRAIESDDEFQTEHFVGGFDATEDAFCFSYYSLAGERWLQVTLEEVAGIASGASPVLTLRSPE
jgi:hypothetical protein